MYAIINGSEERYPISSVSSFITQNGNMGIRVEGDMPQTDKGFKIYSDKLIGDYSAFVYSYGADEYTKVSEDKVEATGTNEPLPSYDPFVAINQRINAITPYTHNKTAYIGDTECIFNKVKDGNISAWIESKPCTYEVIDDKIIVSFEELEEVTTVHISIQ